jgi:Beta-propeller repeat.
MKKITLLFVVVFCATTCLNVVGQDKAKWAKYLGGDAAISPEMSHTGDASINNVVLKNNHLYVNGYYSITGCWNGVALPEDIGVNGMVSKLDLDGNVIWTSTITGISFPNNFTDIAVDSQGDVVATGWASSYWEPGDCKINGEVVIPFHEDENVMWETFNKGFVAKFSGVDGSLVWFEYWETDREVFTTRITLDENDNIYLAGHTWGNYGPSSIMIGDMEFAIPSKYSENLLYFKMNSNGKCQWIKTLEGVEVEELWGEDQAYMNPRSIIHNNGKLYIGMNYYGTITINETTLPFSEAIGGHMCAILEINATNGAITNFTTFGGVKSEQSIARLKCDSNGNIIAVGYYYLIDGFKVGDITLTGTATADHEDAFVAKFDNNLNVLWAKSIGGNYNDRAFNVTVTENDFISIGGGFDPASPFHYGGTALTESRPTGLSLFQLLINGQGEAVDLHTLYVLDGHSTYTNSETVIETSTKRMFSVGNWLGDANLLDPTGEPITEDHSKGFVMEWHRGIISSVESYEKENFSLSAYPNPVADQLRIMLGNSSNPISVVIRNTAGMQVLNTSISNGQTINLQSLASGLYLISVSDGTVEHVSKIVKQ